MPPLVPRLITGAFLITRAFSARSRGGGAGVLGCHIAARTVMATGQPSRASFCTRKEGAASPDHRSARSSVRSKAHRLAFASVLRAASRFPKRGSPGSRVPGRQARHKCNLPDRRSVDAIAAARRVRDVNEGVWVNLSRRLPRRRRRRGPLPVPRRELAPDVVRDRVVPVRLEQFEDAAREVVRQVAAVPLHEDE